MSAPAYITTPIYYVNDKPHIGHAYTTTLCDVWARAMRFVGRDVFFLTGTDEHGLKVEQSATARGISPQALADENAAEFERVLSTFDLTNDDFIRTTQPRHERQVQEFVRRLVASGDVYLGTFEGWYDEGQEEYHTETKAKELEYRSPISGRPLVRATEENYYFRLSRYADFLQKHFADHPDFVRPEGRRNEVLGRLAAGLQDVPITRTNFRWGIPMPGDAPGDERHVIYVWIDALFNYITALELGTPGAVERAKYWPASFHVIGKEILWFHAVIWPALLKALDLPLPRCVYAHSFWISEGQKMSKSLGNFIDLPSIQRYVDTYSLDAWRWYMITQGPLEATDADFSAKHFHEIYTADLVNTFANCASRVSAMIGKYFGGKLPERGPSQSAPPETKYLKNPQVGMQPPYLELAEGLEADTTRLLGRSLGLDGPGEYGALRLREAARSGLEIVRLVDEFVNLTQPFKLFKPISHAVELAIPGKMAALADLLCACAEGVCRAAIALHPVMPAKCEEVLASFGTSLNDWRDGKWQQLRLPAGSRVVKCSPFLRLPAP